MPGKTVIQLVTIRHGEKGETELNDHGKRSVRKRTFAAVLAVLFAVYALGAVPAVLAEEGAAAVSGPTFQLGESVDAAILIDFDTGQVLYERNADQARPPASMTKLMTEYIVLSRIAEGKLNWTDVVPVSKEAALTPADGSQIYLAEGDKHTVEELYIAMAVGSANDATVALASHIAGSEAGFVDMMNDKARELGLSSARFTGSTGLQEDTVISARDLSKLARIILQEHGDTFLKYSSITQYKFRERDKAPMVNYNWMLEGNKDVTNFRQYAYDGVDGMKTGYISAAGYCFTGTAKRGDMRLISVVMGTDSMGERFLETAKLFDYGFNNFEMKTVVAPKSVVESVETVKIKKGVKTEVPVVTDADVTFLVRKGVEPQIEVANLEVQSPEELVAPIPAGTKVGTVTYVYTDGGYKLEKTVSLITSEEAKKGSWWRLMFRGIGDFFRNLFKGITG
jgi:D-alanyl-D-alanine carboxypeptidase